MEITAVYKEDMYFETKEGDISVGMDASPKFGGRGKGLLPKQLLLSSLAGCTGMDVISILKKMKQPVEGFEVQVAAEKSTTEPVVFTKIHIKYMVTGDKVDKQKVEKAVRLSQEKYCGVSAMLKKAAELTWEIVYQ